MNLESAPDGSVGGGGLLTRVAFAAVVVLGVAVIGTTYAIVVEEAVPAPVIASQGANVPRPAGATVEVTYIANEGVLLAADGKQVLIDGLHREYEPSYPFLPQPYRDQIETARPPFDRIDLVLVSHFHLDHFHPEAVASYLRHNPRAVLVSSAQVAGEVEAKGGDYAAIRPRVTASTPALRERRPLTAGGVTSELLGVGHVNARHRTVQNLGHLITLGGKTLLHVGDADVSPENFDAFDLESRGIDVAFLPVWFLTSDAGAALIRDHIRPKHLVAVHLPASDPARDVARIQARFPDAVAFTALLEKRYY